MRKEIYKCDFCGKELEGEKDAEYYEIHRKSLPDWCTATLSTLDWEVKKEICRKCLEKAGLKWTYPNHF